MRRVGFLRRSVVGRIASYAWSWLGPIRRRLLFSPLIAGALTVSETLVLLLAAKLLLGFTDEQEQLDIGMLGIDERCREHRQQR